MGEPRRRHVWRQRIRDAVRAEPPPLPGIRPGEVVHRALLLLLVVLFTALSVGVAAIPAVAMLGKTVAGISARFDEEVTLGDLPQVAQRSVVLDREGRLIATLAGEENREVVPLGRVPVVTRNAVLAIEDARFYDHHGVDLGGLLRAMFSNVAAGDVRQGGSTITQQLVKNTLVGSERSIDRKIREARLAVALEERMSKRQILELYLNETYFGEGVYGIGTAAEYYFGRDVRRIGLAESALLAGIIKAPENFNPIDEPEAALSRRNLVLDRMVAEEMIAPERADRARSRPLAASPHPLPPPKVPYFVEFVKQQILDDARFGETRAERAGALFQAGLRIHTTLDLRLQRGAADSVAAVLDRPDDPASALVSIEPGTGAVRAMVGGRDFDAEKYNLAVQGRRQPGSTFKPFTLVAALDAGFPPGYTLDTPSPVEITDANGEKYVVSNYDGKGRGFIDMRQATELSVNTFYVQLIQKVGPEKVVEAAERMGIQSELQPYLSLALGTIEVSPFEMASAYGTLANRGAWCRPFAIARVEDARGEPIVRNEPECEQRISRGVAAQATDILYGVPLRGTGQRNGRIGRPNAAKTGTTDGYTDAWYAGFTPQLSTVVWLGFPESNARPLYDIHGYPKVFGGSLPAMIWSRFMRLAHASLPVANLPTPPGVGSKEVPEVAGLTVAEAAAALDEERFGYAITEVRATEPAGAVLAQKPRAGKTVPAGTLVELTVSNGKRPREPEPEPDEPSPSPSPSEEPRGRDRGRDPED